MNQDIDIESVRSITFQAEDDINFFNEDFDFDVETANVGIEAEKTFELHNDFGVVLNYDSLGRIMINESRQAESDLHINQSGGDKEDEQSGGICLENGTTRWRIYNSSTGSSFLRFNYSSDDGVSYMPKAYISNTGQYFVEPVPSAFKKRQQPNSYLSRLLALQINEYANKSKGRLGVDGKYLYSLFPQLVEKDDTLNKINGIDYAGLSMVAIKSIQEQQEIIESQANEIDVLKKKNQELENRIMKLESMFENAYKK